MIYKLSKHALDVTSARNIKIQWIESVLDNPSLVKNISNKEINYFSKIEDNENRCLKVVFNPITKIVITAYFDRNMRKRGCK